MNKTNGGFEPWKQSQKKEGEAKNLFSILPPGFEDSSETSIPREIARENFGSTFTKFGQPNTIEKNEKSHSRSEFQSPVLIKNQNKELTSENESKLEINLNSDLDHSRNSPIPSAQTPHSPHITRPTFSEVK